ncbi:hypothetical protein [Microcoleus sp. FACHB-1515]|nr:hypothetical protein [Microcoleus sp. FACHB-1515]
MRNEKRRLSAQEAALLVFHGIVCIGHAPRSRVAIAQTFMKARSE